MGPEGREAGEQDLSDGDAVMEADAVRNIPGFCS